MTAKSGRMLVDAVLALGSAPDERELRLVALALLRGPQDLVAELRRAAAGDWQAYDRLVALVRAGDASPFTFLDLVVALGGGSNRKMAHGAWRAPVLSKSDLTDGGY